MSKKKEPSKPTGDMISNGLMAGIKDDEYREITNEFEQVRKFVGMYISQVGTEGGMHLLKEVFNNALDECTNINSIQRKVKTIHVLFDESTRTFVVEDAGRGIPFDKMVTVCTKKHSTTKDERKDTWLKGQAGRNGVGVKVTVALSDSFSMVSYRGNSKKTLQFVDGIITQEEIKPLKKMTTGLVVTFHPSERYLGEMHLTRELVEEYFRRIAYVLPDDVVIDVTLKKGTESHTVSYHSLGLKSNVEFISTSIEFPPVEVGVITEDYDLLMAFSYDRELDEKHLESYCNYIYTKEGGNHELVAERAICDFFSKQARILDPSAKYEVSYEDCRKGLILVVNCRHIDPAYEGQHKTRVSNRDVLQEGKGQLIQALKSYFQLNNALLRKIVSYLRQVAKARLEAHKIRGVVTQKASSFQDDSKIKGYLSISDRNSKGYAEILMTEGESAGGAIDTSRDNEHQAIFMVTGVINNVFDMTESTVSQVKTLAEMTYVLGCGLGDKCDVTKLRFNKVIINTDSDIDGSNITSLLCCFFYLFMRPLVEAGKLYKALPPLYLINTDRIKKFYKGKGWLFDKKEIHDVYHQMIVDNTELYLVEEDHHGKNDGLEKLTKQKAREFLDINSEYFLELDNFSKRTYCMNLPVLEKICFYAKETSLDENPKKHAKTFQALLQEDYPELLYSPEEQSIHGAISGEAFSIIIDPLFFRTAQRFLSVMNQNPTIFLYCKNRNDKNDTMDRMTIGEFLMKMDSRYTIEITQRYKGLGEADASVLFDTAMNPKARHLLQLTVENTEKTMEMFEILHSKTPKMREKRRQILRDFQLSYMDIDN